MKINNTVESVAAYLLNELPPTFHTEKDPSDDSIVLIVGKSKFGDNIITISVSDIDYATIVILSVKYSVYRNIQDDVTPIYLLVAGSSHVENIVDAAMGIYDHDVHDHPILKTTKEAHRYSGVASNKLSNDFRFGKTPAIKLGRRWVTTTQMLDHSYNR